MCVIGKCGRVLDPGNMSLKIARCDDFDTDLKYCYCVLLFAINHGEGKGFVLILGDAFIYVTPPATRKL